MDNQSNTTLENIQKTSDPKLSTAEASDYDQAQKRLEIIQLLDVARIPKRHRNTQLMPNERWKKQLDELDAKLKSGILCALIGKRGTGKTQMASYLAQKACHQGISAVYHVAMDFFMALKETYNQDFDLTEINVINQFITPQLLILDEIHERGETDWENRLLTYMIDKRYSAMKDTVLISNQTLDVFQKAIGSSILSRLQETGAVILCDWPSFRETDLPQAG